ncbi:MAG: sugar phosphate isomerase/epimerase [Deltaproteobacteria bacterium]|nr:sugar phosphate isomerase/epimerase [Deltaproteobacteria bacterium]
MKKKVQVHVPYPMLTKRLEDVVEAGIDPEVYVDGATLDRIDRRELRDIREILTDRGLRITLHGPYMDLSPGAADEKVRLITMERYRQTLDVVAELRPACVVLHAGYDARRFDGDVDLWLGQSLKTWPEFIEKAARSGTVIAAENVFEEDPGPLKRLVESFNSPVFGVCLDPGHLNLFSKAPMEEWFRAVGPRIAEVHLHDNRGGWDEHLPIGDGGIDFPLFFTLLKKYSKDPVYTIEPHGEDALQRALEAARRYI